jgi:hypothetical protein
LFPLLASVENSSFGQTVTVPIAFDGLPPVAPELDVAALRANILDSQRNGQPQANFRYVFSVAEARPAIIILFIACGNGLLIYSQRQRRNI